MPNVLIDRIWVERGVTSWRMVRFLSRFVLNATPIAAEVHRALWMRRGPRGSTRGLQEADNEFQRRCSSVCTIEMTRRMFGFIMSNYHEHRHGINGRGKGYQYIRTRAPHENPCIAAQTPPVPQARRRKGWSIRDQSIHAGCP
jgi:hypothetical protein